MTLNRSWKICLISRLLAPPRWQDVRCRGPIGVSREKIAAYEAAVASIGCEMPRGLRQRTHESDYLPVERCKSGELTREQCPCHHQIRTCRRAQIRAVTSLTEGGSVQD